MNARVGRWELLAVLGRGGAGVVWRARDAAGREAALKLLAPGPRDAVRRARFAREVDALLRLRHEHLVRLLEAGEHEGQPWLAMELVTGRTLEQRLREEGPLPPRQAAELVQGLARALAYAHGCGVLHRDLKPANVLLDAAGRPRLTDFGLAKDLGQPLEATRLSTSGVFLGTPGYWSPEQAAGDWGGVGPQSDVYGLGATLYACLTGRAPLSAESLAAHVMAAQEAEPEPPSRLCPGLDPALERLCLRCLAKDPARRPPSTEVLARELGTWLRGPSPAGSPDCGRPGRGALLAALTLAAGLISGAVILLRRPPSQAGAAAPAMRAPAPTPAPAPTGSPARELADRALRRGLAGDLRGALEDWDRSLALDPGYAVGWHDRGVLRERLGDSRGALADYDRALELDPGLASAWTARSACHLAQGDPLRALADADRALALAPTAGRAHMNRGAALAQLDRPGEALESLARATELLPGEPLAWTNYGAALYQSGRSEEGLACLDRALELEPGLVVALVNRGLLLEDLGRAEQARADLEEALRRLPAAHAHARVAREALARLASPGGSR